MECERKINYREVKQYLERSFSVKVQVEALEDLLLLGPDDVEVPLRRFKKESKRRKRAKYV